MFQNHLDRLPFTSISVIFAYMQANISGEDSTEAACGFPFSLRWRKFPIVLEFSVVQSDRSEGKNIFT
jgi:hypothetical protein